MATIPANFVGTAIPRSQGIFLQIARRLGCEESVVRAVISVEASTSGFLPDRRPKILFERHKFHGFTRGRWSQSHSSISNPNPGGYVGGAGEYQRLARAMELDRNAALRSASWGAPQIMGFNHSFAGFPTVDAMIAAFCRSEDEQLLAFATFIESAGLTSSLRTKNWTEFARGYNGPNFRINSYDSKLVAAYARAIGSANGDSGPSNETREIQSLLNAHGFGPLSVDGWMGPKTRAAIEAFQKASGLEVDGIVGPKTRAALTGGTGAVSVPISPIGGVSPGSDSPSPAPFNFFTWIVSIIRRLFGGAR